MFKRIILFAVIMQFGVTTLNFAQGMGRMTPEERTKQLTEQLKLNKDQTKKVEAIMKKSQEQISKIVQSGGGFGDPETRDKMMKLREESNNEIMKILTDKQKTEYKKILDEQRKRMEERRRNMTNQ